MRCFLVVYFCLQFTLLGGLKLFCFLFLKQHLFLCDLLNLLSFSRTKRMKPRSTLSQTYVLVKKKVVVFSGCGRVREGRFGQCKHSCLFSIHWLFFLVIFLKCSLPGWRSWAESFLPPSLFSQQVGRPRKCLNACLWCMVIYKYIHIYFCCMFIYLIKMCVRKYNGVFFFFVLTVTL